MDKIWNYKNFNMGNELNIAGEFIYDGIQTLNQTTSISEGATIFSFLYHISVGIERLQKILIVLFEEINSKNHEEFEKNLITHSHSFLHERISKKVSIVFNSRENDFLTILTNFYNHSRYNRFNLNSPYCQEKELIEDYILKYVKKVDIYRSVSSNDILVNQKVKNLFGRAIGSIASKYYENIRKIAHEKGTYTYELRSDSKAEKIFLSNYPKKSLQEIIDTETVALKEFLLFISNTRKRDPFVRFFKSISPLKMDIAMINEYIMDICNGVIPQTLVDEVESLYEENGYSKERLDQINLIGNPNIMFAYGEIRECIKYVDSFLSGEIDTLYFAKKFPIMAQKIKDDDFSEFTLDIRNTCKKLRKTEISEQDFIDCVRSLSKEIKEIYRLER